MSSCYLGSLKWGMMVRRSKGILKILKGSNVFILDSFSIFFFDGVSRSLFDFISFFCLFFMEII